MTVNWLRLLGLLVSLTAVAVVVSLWPFLAGPVLGFGTGWALGTIFKPFTITKENDE